MSNEQMINDCTKQIRSKLNVWMKDSAELFDMADLSDSEMLAATLAELIHLSVKIIGRFAPRMPAEEFGEYMAGALREYKSETANKRRARDAT
jgi:hypothetical protein